MNRYLYVNGRRQPLAHPERLSELLSRAVPLGDCLMYQGSKDSRGYGRIRLGGRPANGGKSSTAHRVVYELANGPIPDGLEIDHLCRNRGCINPAHLEAVTHRENVLRKPSAAFCRQGHETAVYRVGAGRGSYCRKCKSAYEAARYRLRVLSRGARVVA